MAPADAPDEKPRLMPEGELPCAAKPPPDGGIDGMLRLAAGV